MNSSLGQQGSAISEDDNLQIGVIDRYIHDALNARADLINNDDQRRRAISNRVLKDIATFFADHMQSVVAARDRLMGRTDSQGRAMRAFIDEVVASHSSARHFTLSALERIIINSARQ